MDWQSPMLLIVVVFSLVGLVLIEWLRSAVIDVGKSKLPIRLSRPALGLASTVHPIVSGEETHGCVVEITIDGVDDATHDLRCHVSLSLSKGVLVELRTIPVGAGAVGHPPLLKVHPTYPSQLVLSDVGDDPTITLVILIAAAWVAEREVRLTWKVSEILEHSNSRINPGNIRLGREVRIATDHEPRAYPDDRYSASFFMPRLFAPPTCMIGSGLFSFVPDLRMRAGSGLQHWELRTRNPDSPHGAIELGLQRGLGERLSIQTLSLVPLLLTGVVAVRLISDPLTTDLFIGSASVFLSIVALHSIVPPSAQAFGLTKADLKLQLGAAMMFLLILLAAIPGISDRPTGKARVISPSDSTSAVAAPITRIVPPDTAAHAQGAGATPDTAGGTRTIN